MEGSWCELEGVSLKWNFRAAVACEQDIEPLNKHSSRLLVATSGVHELTVLGYGAFGLQATVGMMSRSGIVMLGESGSCRAPLFDTADSYKRFKCTCAIASKLLVMLSFSDPTPELLVGRVRLQLPSRIVRKLQGQNTGAWKDGFHPLSAAHTLASYGLIHPLADFAGLCRASLASLARMLPLTNCRRHR